MWSCDLFAHSNSRLPDVFPVAYHPMSFTVRNIHERRRKPGELLRKAGRMALAATGPLLILVKIARERKAQEHQQLLLKRIFAAVLALLIVCAVGIGTVHALVLLRNITFQSVSSIAGATLPKDSYGATNVLLLGQGDRDHEGIDLTDTVLIASLQPSSNSVLMVSLPRDLYFLHADELGAGRINTLYRDRKIQLHRQGLETAEASKGAMQDLAEELSRTLGIQLHGVIKVDFTALTETVDALGGIDIDVPQAIEDPEYPDENYGYQVFSLAAGPQHMDGATALKYARSRHSTSDFSRAARQQLIVHAMGQKAKEKGIITDLSFLSAMIKTLQNHMETTLSTAELVALGAAAKDVDESRLLTMQLSDQNGLYSTLAAPGGFLYSPPREQFEGASVLLPVSIPEFPVTWRQVQSLFTLLQKHRDMMLRKPAVTILNAGAKSGLGRLLGSELTRYGFALADIANADLEDDLPFSSIISRQGAKEDATTISSLLNLPQADAPQLLPLEQQSDITILLGKDYKYVPLQGSLTPPQA